MNKTVFILSIILVGWIAGGAYVYTCKIKQLCYDPAEASISEREEIEEPSTEEEAVSELLDTVSTATVEEGTTEDTTPTQEEVLQRTYTIYFQPMSTELIVEETHRVFFRQAKDWLVKNPEGRLQLIGHTDSTGSPERNIVFGEKRAQSVKAYLVAAVGLPPIQIEVDSKGQAQPLADNTTETGRAKNRRVELYIRR